ncbi:serine/threonine protein kinase [Candidatus Bathyarchaeota archaeon]|nr:serine/threonine protein kinase [Candidatus Bathyarchaeota archaeon]
MKNALVISLEKLSEEPYASVMCYPRPGKAELQKRLKELRKLRVKALEFSGEKQVFNIPVLGKGYVGIVIIAYVDGEKAALKVRRVDADRSGMQREAEMLKKANSVHVGPRLFGVSKNFLLMQFIDGDLLPKWLENRKGKAEVRKVLREVLEQCWRLDEAGLDHGELSRAPKHIILDPKDEPFIVDFETASVNRKPSNVTSICQFLFISGAVADEVAVELGGKDEKAIINALRNYKSDRTRENFGNVLRACGL